MKRSTVSPSALAWELLEEYERDPKGLGFLDLEKLLDEWGVTDSLPGHDLSGYRARAHPLFPGRFVYYPVQNELAPPIIHGVCTWLRNLHRSTHHDN